MIEAGEIENNELFFHHRRVIETMPYDEAHSYTNDLLADPSVPHSVKARLNKYIKSTDAQENYRNNRIDRILDQRIKDGIPIDPKLLDGATGQVYHKGRQMIAEQNGEKVQLGTKVNVLVHLGIYLLVVIRQKGSLPIYIQQDVLVYNLKYQNPTRNLRQDSVVNLKQYSLKRTQQIFKKVCIDLLNQIGKEQQM